MHPHSLIMYVDYFHFMSVGANYFRISSPLAYIIRLLDFFGGVLSLFIVELKVVPYRGCNAS